MSTLYKDIRDGLIANLQPLNDGGDWIKLSPYALASPNPPCIQLMPGSISYDIANSRGGDLVKFTIQAIVVNNFDQGAQTKLDLLLADGGALSIKALVESDSSLGGVVDDLRVVSNTGYQVYALAGRGACLGADWEVEILTSTV